MRGQHESIVSIACGLRHNVALTADGRVLTWGFGAEGCLGHGEAEAVPEVSRKAGKEEIAGNEVVDEEGDMKRGTGRCGMSGGDRMRGVGTGGIHAFTPIHTSLPIHFNMPFPPSHSSFLHVPHTSSYPLHTPSPDSV